MLILVHFGLAIKINLTLGAIVLPPLKAFSPGFKLRQPEGITVPLVSPTFPDGFGKPGQIWHQGFVSLFYCFHDRSKRWQSSSRHFLKETLIRAKTFRRLALASFPCGMHFFKMFPGKSVSFARPMPPKGQIAF